MAELKIPNMGSAVNLGVGGPTVHQPVDPFSGPRPGARKLVGELEALGAKLKEQEEEQNARLDTMRAVQAKGAAEQRAAARIAELDVTSATYEEDAHTAYMEEAAEAGANTTFSTGEARDLYNTRATEAAMRVRVSAFERKTAATIDLATVQREEMEETFKSRVRNNPDQADAIMAEFEQQAAMTDGVIPKHVLAKRNEALMDDVILARAEGMAEQGRFNEATDFLDSAEAEGVSPENVRAMKKRIKGIESHKRLDYLRGTMNQVAQLHHLVATGQAGPREIDAARDAGLFFGREGSEWALRTMAVNVAKAQANTSRKVEESIAALQGGWGTQSDANRILEAQIEAQEREGGELSAQDRVDLSLEMTRLTNFVPSTAQDVLANQGISNNPAVLAQAAKNHAEFAAINPVVDTGAPERAQAVASLIADGEDPLQAAQLVIDGEKGPPPTKDEKDSWKETAADADWSGMIAGANKNLTEDQVEANPELVSRATRIASKYVKALGPEQAMKIGAKLASRTYAPTTMYGMDKAQEFAPDAMLKAQTPPHLYGDQVYPRYIQDKLKEQVSAAGITPGVSSPDQEPWGVDKNGIPPAWAATDAQTRQDAAAGRPLSYRLYVRDEYGYPKAIYNARTGKYARFILPTKEEFAKDMNQPAVKAKKKQEASRRSKESARLRKREGANRAAINKRTKQIGEEMDKLPSTSGKF